MVIADPVIKPCFSLIFRPYFQQINNPCSVNVVINNIRVRESDDNIPRAKKNFGRENLLLAKVRLWSLALCLNPPLHVTTYILFDGLLTWVCNLQLF